MACADYDLVEVLASEFVSRHRSGEYPTIDEYAIEYPELADDIKELFPIVAALEKLKIQEARSIDGRASLAGAQIERFGDLRMIREIGRGGMGVVFEAEQESVGRQVAVKVLPKQLRANAKYAQRFQYEARTAASLHHPNIVPVLDVGQQDGFHYYVMQRIDGVGLDEILRQVETGACIPAAQDLSGLAHALTEDENGRGQHEEFSTLRNRAIRDTSRDGTMLETHWVRGQVDGDGDVLPATPRDSPSASSGQTPDLGSVYWQSAARLGAQVAEALQYTHAKGILHRDIKPANLIVDAQGTAWIADFGLAKALDEEETGASDDVVGTLPYMAPERLQREEDARSDIYSLGLTLYEMLTLCPAFGGTDRDTLVHQIVTDEPARPRQIRPEIPEDLEAIVLKAIAREPEHRYQSAGELAADLQRFLDDRPADAQTHEVAPTSSRFSESRTLPSTRCTVRSAQPIS